MKKLFFIIFTLVISAGAFAQTKTTTTTITKVTTAHPATHCCAKCGSSFASAGKCTKCSATVVKNGTYYCPKCDGVSSAISGTCPKCMGPLTYMDCKKPFAK